MAKKKVQVSTRTDFRFAPTSGANSDEYRAAIAERRNLYRQIGLFTKP